MQDLTSNAGRPRLAAILLATAGLLSAFVLLKVSAHGLGFYSDSEIYIETARDFLRGHGLTMPDVDGAYVSEPFFPPGFALLLSLSHVLSMDPLEGARLLQAAFLATNCLLLGWIVWQKTENLTVALVTPLLFTFSRDLFTCHYMLWSEPAFLFFLLGAMASVASYLEKKKPVSLWAAGILTSAVWLTRYAGVAWVAAGVVALLVLDRSAWNNRLSRVILFSLLSAAPMALWVFLAQRGDQSVAGRKLVPHIHPLLAALPDGINTMLSWIFQDDELRWPLALKAAIVLFIAILLLYRILKRPPDRATFLIQVIALFMISYLGLLLITITFFDASTTLDFRILVPVHVGCLMLLALLAGDRISSSTGPTRGAMTCVFICGAIWFLWRGVAWTREVRSEEEGYAAATWKNSDVIRQIRTLPPSVHVYSNVPYPVIVYADRFCGLLPTSFNVNTLQPNPQYGSDLTDLQRRIDRHTAVIAFFNNQEDEDNGVPPLSELENRLRFHVLKRNDEGVLLD